MVGIVSIWKIQAFALGTCKFRLNHFAAYW